MRIHSFVLTAGILCSMLAALPAKAQVDNSPNIPLPKGPRLVSPSVANPKFPLKVWLRIDHNQWEGTVGYYHALGKFMIDPSTAVVYDFDYQCSVTFRKPATTGYQAR